MLLSGGIGTPYFLRKDEIDALEGSRASARVLGADEIVTAKVTPDGPDLIVELVREVVSFDEKGRLVLDKHSIDFPAPPLEASALLLGAVSTIGSSLQ
jgi:hypothetical protein